MPKVSQEATFPFSAEQIFKVIADFESYPKFVDGVSSLEVLERDGNRVRAKYGLNLIKTFSYILDLVLDSPTRLTWTLVEGDFFKTNSGGWTLTDLGNGSTKVVYELDVDFKIFAPGMLVRKLVDKNLPATVECFRKRVESLNK